MPSQQTFTRRASRYRFPILLQTKQHASLPSPILLIHHHNSPILHQNLHTPRPIRPATIRKKPSPPTKEPTTTTIETAQVPSPSPPPPPPPKSRTLTRTLLPKAISAALTLLLTLDFIFTHVGQFMTVTGPSMSPLLNTSLTSSTSSAPPSSQKDIVYVRMTPRYPPSSSTSTQNPISISNPNPENHPFISRGAIIALISPLHSTHLAVKRVVALPGDVVTTRAPYPEREVEVPAGHIWVEGEHPGGSRWSCDSNTYGPVSAALVIGRVMGVVWPWRRRQWLDEVGGGGQEARGRVRIAGGW